MDQELVATWIQAIGSAGSLLAFSVWVGIAVINRRDEHEARFLRQAQTVAAWLEEGVAHDMPEAPYVVRIANGGDAPVYDCTVTIPGTARDGKDPVAVQLVPPRQTITRAAPDGVESMSWDEAFESGVAPVLEFTDSSGRRWRRDTGGVLEDIGIAQRQRARTGTPD